MKSVLDSADRTLVIVTPPVTSLVVHVVGPVAPDPDGTADAIVAGLTPPRARAAKWRRRPTVVMRGITG
ncbi:hypothetical protein [Streptomyces pratensis]|uniref:hypothetical protein n=1 Tax=Streptomyces pratensis TaxID=1169025 RepID=UPI001933F398|nr:hypothetical protein [Streptomyces pratensis]